LRINGDRSEQAIHQSKRDKRIYACIEKKYMNYGIHLIGGGGRGPRSGVFSQRDPKGRQGGNPTCFGFIYSGGSLRLAVKNLETNKKSRTSTRGSSENNSKRIVSTNQNKLQG